MPSQSDLTRRRWLGVRGLFNLVWWPLILLALVLLVLGELEFRTYAIGWGLVTVGWCGGWLDGRLSR